MIKFKDVSQIEGKDIRFIESCFRVLEHQGEQLPSSFETSVEGAKIINQVIASREATSEEKEKMVQSLIAEAEQALLPLDEFSWFKDDERTCYFVWASIYSNSFNSAPNHPAFTTPEQQLKQALNYHRLSLKKNPSSSMERFNEVVKYFDRVRQPSKWKLELIAFLKSIWSMIFSTRKPFRWLDRKNEEQCQWAWDYIQKNDSGSLKPNTYQLQATSTKEMYLAIYAAYDIWRTDNGTKRLFTSDFNRAWQQKKLRDGRQGKKACSLVLHEDIKNKLDELAETRKVTLSQLVEQLIEKEYLLKDS